MDETLKISQYTQGYTVCVFAIFNMMALQVIFIGKLFIQIPSLKVSFKPELHSTYLLFYIEQVFLSERGQEKTLFTYP